MLVQFTNSDSNSPVWVNPDHVVKAYPYADDPDVTILRIVDGEQFGVKGKVEDVVEKLNKG
jgi:uncharacterized protein YlzI (FlbEa/FlbD family)